MSYSVETAPRADEDLGRLPAPLGNAVIRRFIEFAKNPGVGGSVSAPSLYTPGQLLEMQFNYDQMTCRVGVVFRYAQDEQTLVIERVYAEFV
jgi:hypothetical protein